MQRSAAAFVLAPVMALALGVSARSQTVAPESGTPPAPEAGTGQGQDPVPPDSAPPAPGLPPDGKAPPGGPTLEDVSFEPPEGAEEIFETVDWRDWWEANSPSCLHVAPRAREIDRKAGDPAYGLGPGTSAQKRGPSAEIVADRVVPALVSLIEDREADAASVGAALIALGRVEAAWSAARKSAPDARGVIELAEERLRSSEHAISEGAIVALGACAQAAAVDGLVEILSDSVVGRRACGRGLLDGRTRMLAASALGLAASAGDEAVARRVAAALLERIATPGALPYEVELACLVSLGLARLGPCSSHSPAAWHVCRTTQIERLSSYVRDSRRRVGLRAQAGIALARLAEGGKDEPSRLARELVLDELQGRNRNSPEMQQGCAIALGLIGDCDEDALDARIRAALGRLADKGDSLARGLAAISLAKVAARGGGAPIDVRARHQIQKELIDRLAHGADDRRAWAALAIGVHGYALERAGQPRPPELGAALAKALARERSVDDAQAQCLGLALLQDPASRPALLGCFEGTREPGLRAAAACAIGWTGGKDALAPLKAEFSAGPRRSSVFPPAAVALRLLGDGAVVPGTVEMLHVELKKKNTEAAATCAALLGQLGDPMAIPALAGTAADRAHRAKVRAAAATALAELCEPGPVAWGAAWTAEAHLGLGFADRLRFLQGGRRPEAVR